MPMISFVDSITVLQRQDWLRGKLLYKREKKTQNRGLKTREQKKKKQKQNQSKNKAKTQRKK